MSLKSSSERYGSVAVGLHWGSAVLIVVLLALGFSAANTPSEEVRRALLGPHMILGISILLLTIIRIAWWIFDSPPQPVPGQNLLQTRTARVVHFLIYGLLIATATTGIGTSALGGVREALMAGTPIPPLDDIAPRRGHGVLAWTFVALLILHTAAALYHHFIRRDRTLLRMLGKTG